MTSNTFMIQIFLISIRMNQVKQSKLCLMFECLNNFFFPVAANVKISTNGGGNYMVVLTTLQSKKTPYFMYFHRMYLLKAIMGCITHKIQNKQPFLDIKEVKPIIYCFFFKKTASFF